MGVVGGGAMWGWLWQLRGVELGVDQALTERRSEGWIKSFNESKVTWKRRELVGFRWVGGYFWRIFLVKTIFGAAFGGFFL